MDEYESATSDYDVAGEVADELGWRWGGGWRDYGHFAKPEGNLLHLYMNKYASGVPPSGGGN